MILCHRTIFHSSNCKALHYLMYEINTIWLEYFVLRASKCWHEKRHSWPTISLRNTFRTRLTVHTTTTSLDLNSAHFHWTVNPIWMEHIEYLERIEDHAQSVIKYWRAINSPRRRDVVVPDCVILITGGMLVGGILIKWIINARSCVRVCVCCVHVYVHCAIR